MNDKKENNEDELITSLDSSSTASSDSESQYPTQFKSRHTITKHGITGCNNDDMSVDTDMSDFLIDSKQDLSHKDIFISALQEQVKKMEEMYKKKLDDSQLLRLKFCRTAQELNDLKKICHVYEAENKELREKVIAPQKNVTEEKSKEANLEMEYEELLKKINTMENNTIAMKDILELKGIDLCKHEQQVYNADINLNEMYSMYKNIQTILDEHSEKFDLLANKLNIKYDSKHSVVIATTSSQTFTEDVDSSLNSLKVNIGTASKVQMRKYEEKSKLLDECLEKIEYLEGINMNLKAELEMANKGKDTNLKELNKIQDEVHEGSKTLHMCLCELKLLKEENRDNAEHQNVLEEENQMLKIKIKQLEIDLEGYSEQLEATEKEVKIYKEREEDSVYCICELKQQLDDKDKFYKEKRQKYRDKISSISSSEAMLRTKITDQQVMEKTILELSTGSEQMKKELDEKDVKIANLENKIILLEKAAEETKTHLNGIIENLTQKCECSFKEIEDYRLSVKLLEDKNIVLMNENIKLSECLKAANEQLEYCKETQESLQKTLDSQNELVNHEKERVENEIEDANILSSYLNEQLNIAKLKYNELLPLTENCCCKHITEIIFWLQKQNENLKMAQSNLMKGLQNKLNEARQKNNVDTFTVVKDVMNLMLEGTYADKEMSNEMKLAFEKLMEKRKLFKQHANLEVDEICNYSDTPEETNGSNKKKNGNKIDVIMEEPEENTIEETMGDNQQAIDTSDANKQKESERYDENERNAYDKMATEESKFNSKSTPIMISDENIQKILDKNSLVRCYTSSTKLSCFSSSTYSCSCENFEEKYPEKSQSKTDYRTESVPQSIHVQHLPYICLNSPVDSTLDLKEITINCIRNNCIAKDEIIRPTTGNEQGSSISSTTSEPVSSNNKHIKAEAIFSDSDSSDKSYYDFAHCKETKFPCNPCNNPEQAKTKRTKRNHSPKGSATKIDDYLNNLSKMEKKVGNLRMELRTSSASRSKNKPSDTSTKGGKPSRQKLSTTETRTRHGYHAICLETANKPGNCGSDRKDYKKPRGSK